MFSPKFSAERKRTCLIVSLISSLQQDETAKAMKNEQETKDDNCVIDEQIFIRCYLVGLFQNETFNETLHFVHLSLEYYTHIN